MARQNPGNNVPSQNTILTITDIHGNIVLEVRDEEMLVIGSHNQITSYSRTGSMQTVDGTVFTIDMLKAKPPIYLGVCEECRHPQASLFRNQHATHGIVAMHRAKLCVSCGVLCCPSHRKLGKDKKWRCLSCHKKNILGRLIRPIFFAKED